MTGKKTLAELLAQDPTEQTPSPTGDSSPLRPSGRGGETLRRAPVTTPKAPNQTGKAQASITAKIGGFSAIAGGSAPADGYTSTPGGSMDTGYSGDTDMIDVDAPQVPAPSKDE